MKNWAHWRSYWTWGRCCVFTFQFPIALNLKGAFFKDLFDFLGPHWVTHNLSPNFYASYMRWWNVDMLKCCLWWQDVIMTHRHDDIMTMLTWWHDDMMTCWEVDMLTWWHIDMMTWWQCWHDDMMTWWHDDMLTCWHVDMLTCWHVDMLTWWHGDMLT